MDPEKRKGGFKSFISGVYLVAAVCLLVGVCAHCYPDAGQRLRQAIAGAEDSPVREAFSVLAEGLGESRPVKEVLSESYEVLVGEKA